MAMFTWKSDYNIGHFKIDKEHQNLFAIARKSLNIQPNLGEIEKKKILKEVLKELYAYTAFHFSNEQEYMKQIGYPLLSSHIELHKELLASLHAVVKKFNDLELEEIQQRICEFVDTTFVRHILYEDKKIELFTTPLRELRKNTGWKDIYILGDKLIDKEHRKIFALADVAFQEVNDEKRLPKLKEIVQELYNYIKTHFEHEEAYMRKIEYPHLSEHQKIHQEIIAGLNAFLKNLPNTFPHLFEKQLAITIETSIIQHIIQEDKKITEWIRLNNNKKVD